VTRQKAPSHGDRNGSGGHVVATTLGRMAADTKPRVPARVRKAEKRAAAPGLWWCGYCRESFDTARGIADHYIEVHG